MSKSSKPARPTRRIFLKVAAATASAVAAPNVVSAEGVINMRWQSTWPSKAAELSLRRLSHSILTTASRAK